MQTYFIIGTDTDCGKTYVTCELLKTLEGVIAIKPIQSGGNEDVDRLTECQPHYHKPLALYSFEPPISPNIAAARANQAISFEALDAFCETHRSSNTLLIETTGGLMCPINHKQTWLNYIVHAKKPVIFVIGVQLGCINHSLLTAHALKTHGVSCAGWIANLCEPNMLALQENLATLEQKLPFPRLATVPFRGTISYEERILTD